MDKVTKVTIDSIRSYYKSLFIYGYSNYVNVNNLLVLTFLEEVLNSDMCLYIDEDDYNTIIKALYAITDKSFSMGYPTYDVFKDQDVSLRVDDSNRFRLSEQSMVIVKA